MYVAYIVKYIAVAVCADGSNLANTAFFSLSEEKKKTRKKEEEKTRQEADIHNKLCHCSSWSR